MAVPNFTAATEGLTILALTDTTDYEDTIVSNRYWILTKSNGDVALYPSPIVDGVTIKIEIDKDYALIVELAINYNTVDGTAQFKKTKNVLAAPNLVGIIYDLRKKFLDMELNKTDDTEKLLRDIELIDAFNDAAINLISTDLVAAQKALDRGNDEANKYKCNI